MVQLFAPPEFAKFREVPEIELMDYASTNDLEFEMLAFAAKVRDAVAFMLTGAPQKMTAPNAQASDAVVAGANVECTGGRMEVMPHRPSGIG
jgi:hypothetical protein